MEIMIKCSCKTELIRLEYDKEIKSIILDFWTMAPYGSWGFLKRLKLAWDVIRKGKFATDEVILEKEEVRKMAQFLFRAFNKMNEK